jgi:hypothetical protein
MLCTHECTRLSTCVHSSHQYVYMRTYVLTYVRTYVRTHAYAYVRTRAQARACFTLEQICGRVHAVVKVRACASSRVHAGVRARSFLLIISSFPSPSPSPPSPSSSRSHHSSHSAHSPPSPRQRTAGIEALCDWHSCVRGHERPRTHGESTTFMVTPSIT